jgi:hypothetical protein
VNWHGETCIIVASGPSSASVELKAAKGSAKFIVVNESWRLAPWADVLYACDHAWWLQSAGCSQFQGVKIAGNARTAAEDWGVKAVTVRCVDMMVFDEPGIVGRGGGASGFQAINLAVNWGAKRIILVGFDMVPGKRHWHADHGGGLNNPTDGLMRIWAKALDGAARSLQTRGVEVLNASPSSALSAYPKAKWEDALCRF